mgnify:FL=1
MTEGHTLLFVVGYGCAGALLAVPATFVAVRRGLRAGLLAGAVTALAVALLGLVILIGLVAIFGGGSFGVGFGENVLLIWLLLFFGPALLVGLAFAALWRLARRRRSAAIS